VNPANPAPPVARRLRRLRRLRLLTTGHHVCRSTGQEECRRPRGRRQRLVPCFWQVHRSAERNCDPL